MLTFPIQVIAAATLTLALGAAVAPEVKDDAKFFTPEVVRKVDRQIREIYRKHDRDVLIETVARVPGDEAVRVKNMSREEREKFFRNWATDRAEAAVVNGVYLLICKDPTHLEVTITAKARTVFDKAAFEQLRSTILKEFREKRFDDGLTKAVELVQQRLDASKP